MKYSILLLTVVASSFSANAQINFEQNALDWFCNNAATLGIVGPDSSGEINKIYASDSTSKNYRIPSNIQKDYLNINDRHISFGIIKPKRKKITLSMDCTIYCADYSEFKKKYKSIIDVYLVVHNALIIKNHYYVCIQLKYPYRFIIEDLYLKLDKRGKVIKHYRRSAIR